MTKKTLLACLLALFLCCAPALAEELTEAPTPSPKPTPQAFPIDPTATVKEEILVQREGVTITLKALDFDGFYGPSIQLLVENDTETDLSMQIIDASVNGAMVRTVFDCDVVAGKKINATLSFWAEDLATAGISHIQNIELRFHVYRASNWETLFDSNPVRFTTSLAEEGEKQSFDDGGITVVDKKKVRVILQGLIEDGPDSPGINLRIFIENKSDMDVTVTLRDVSLNGYMISPLLDSQVPAGKVAYDTVVFLQTDIEKNEIASFEEMEAVFYVYETSSYYSVAETDPVLVRFTDVP